MTKRKKTKPSEGRDPRRLKQRALEDGTSAERQTVTVNDDQNMISETFSLFVGPYSDLAGDRASFESIVRLAVIAWNTALLGVEEKRQVVDEMDRLVAPSEGGETRRDIIRVVKMMIRRKEKYFFGDQRLIAGFTVIEAHDGYHLDVVAAEPPDEDPS